MNNRPRTKPLNLLIMEALSRRLVLTLVAKRYLENLLFGYQGELDFDALIEKWLRSGIVLKDVKLKTPLGNCQIDVMIIKGDVIFIYEVKNYLGRHVYKETSLSRMTGTNFDNPDMQLAKHYNRLKSLLDKEGLHFRIVKKVVYINPAMTMYEAPEQNDFIMHGEIEDHLKKVNQMPDAPSYQHNQLIRELKANAAADIRFDDIPEYMFEDLMKGLYCANCNSLSIEYGRNVGICTCCNHQDKIAEMIQRNIIEYKILFPNEPMKLQIISEWCGGEFNRKRIYRGMKKFEERGQTKIKIR